MASSQDRANLIAQALGFKNDYERRKARIASLFNSTPRKLRDTRARERGNPRDYAIERERAEIRAHARGFMSARAQRDYNRAARGTRLQSENFQKTAILKHFGISERRFSEIRRENRHYHNEYGELHYARIYVYNEDLDGDIHNWSERRVGYIISYHAAVVNPNTNYKSLPRKWVRGNKRKGIKGYSERVTDNHGHVITNKSQFFYLVKYAEIMTIDEYENKYGNATISNGVPTS